MSLCATTYIEHTTPEGDSYADPYITGLWCGVHGTPRVMGKIVFLPHFYHRIAQTTGNKRDLND